MKVGVHAPDQNLDGYVLSRLEDSRKIAPGQWYLVPNAGHSTLNMEVRRRRLCSQGRNEKQL